MHNSSLLTADGRTHLKIVVLALLFAILVSSVGVASHMGGRSTKANVVQPAVSFTASSEIERIIR